MNYYKQYEPLFGSWNFVRLIGEGSFGKVFEIERHDIKKTYKSALKAITIPANENELREVMLDGMDEASAKEYFRSVVDEVINEFDLMEQMKGNSNIVSYEDHVIIEHKDGIGWDILIRMELLTPLNKHYSLNGMSKYDVISLGIDMCRALEVCKRNNVIHRDIKPENIFVSANGDYKLGDFGVAKSMENANNSFSKKGTCFYMAPEVYKGKKYDWRVDMYSVGLVMYRYLNDNVLPFIPQAVEALTYKKKEEALERRMSGEPLPSPVVVDDELFSVIRRACAYYPQDRYSSPADMRRELERILSREESIDNIIGDEMFDENGAGPVDGTETDSSNKKIWGKAKKIAVIATALAVVAAAVLAVVMINRNKSETPALPDSELFATAQQIQDNPLNATIVLPTVSEATTELLTELTTVTDVFDDGYVAAVGYSAGSIQGNSYSNEWAGIRINAGDGLYSVSRTGLDGLACLYKANKGVYQSISVMVDRNSNSLVKLGSDGYLLEEYDVRVRELKKSGGTVSDYIPISHDTIGDFKYSYYILERKSNLGTKTTYHGYYYRRIGEDVLVINTVTNTAQASRQLLEDYIVRY